MPVPGAVPTRVITKEPNIITDEGAALVAYLLTGGDCGSGTPTDAFDQAHAYISVSDNEAEPEADETEIGGNVLGTKQCDTDWPQYANRRIEWRATFQIGEAEGKWCRISLQNAAAEDCVNFDLFRLDPAVDYTKPVGTRIWICYIGVTI